MNARGTYGSNSNGQSRTFVGSRLVHTLELKQRYSNVNITAAQTLLRDLSNEGVASSVGTNRWEIALKDGAWALLTYYPDWSALEVTVTDRELRGVDQLARVQRSYEAILAKITPRLQRFGVTTVGAATYAGQQVQQQPRFAARTRAIKAVFDMYTRTRVPYYVYAEVNGMIDKQSSSSLDEANAIFDERESAPGEVYVAIFAPTDPLWPGPAVDVYHGAPQAPQVRPVIGQSPSKPSQQDRRLVVSSEQHAAMRAIGHDLLGVPVGDSPSAGDRLASALSQLVAKRGGLPGYPGFPKDLTQTEVLELANRFLQAVKQGAAEQTTSRFSPKLGYVLDNRTEVDRLTSVPRVVDQEAAFTKLFDEDRAMPLESPTDLGKKVFALSRARWKMLADFKLVRFDPVPVLQAVNDVAYAMDQQGIRFPGPSIADELVCSAKKLPGRLGDAAKKAVLNPYVLVPLGIAGSLVLILALKR